MNSLPIINLTKKKNIQTETICQELEWGKIDYGATQEKCRIIACFTWREAFKMDQLHSASSHKIVHQSLRPQGTENPRKHPWGQFSIKRTTCHRWQPSQLCDATSASQRPKSRRMVGRCRNRDYQFVWSLGILIITLHPTFFKTHTLTAALPLSEISCSEM